MTMGSVVTIVVYLLYNCVCNKRQRRLIKYEQYMYTNWSTLMYSSEN
jgi:hypothetical protein